MQHRRQGGARSRFLLGPLGRDRRDTMKLRFPGHLLMDGTEHRLGRGTVAAGLQIGHVAGDG